MIIKVIRVNTLCIKIGTLLRIPKEVISESLAIRNTKDVVFGFRS